MQKSRIEVINIVGGGSAGWMTALYLNKLFNEKESLIKIRVVESKDIGVIGVGEATVTSIRQFFAQMDIDEHDLIKSCNASFKQGIMFRNWMKPVNGNTHEYFHPFEANLPGSRLDISSNWILSNQRQRERYDEGVCLSPHLIKNDLGPKTKNCQQYMGVVPYGYHIDAVLMGRYLRGVAIERGVEHIEATVSDVNIEAGDIRSIDTDKGVFDGDFFIDCTGFKGLLINKLKSDNWTSFEEELPCNRAVAIQKPYEGDAAPKPYTVATAIDNGWVWQIGLFNREGTGYVYDGNRLSEDEAENELRVFLGDSAEGCSARHLKMRVGCLKEHWVGNCAAIGLSSGFIEPLESTGLHLINLAARQLATHLSSSQRGKEIRGSFNRSMNGIYDDLKQFIVLHYCLTDRDDTEFWRYAKKTVDYCPGLQEKLDLWKYKICEYLDLAGGFTTSFTDENYRYVLYGMGHYPELASHLGEPDDTVFKQVLEMARRAESSAVLHKAYLAKLASI